MLCSCSGNDGAADAADVDVKVTEDSEEGSPRISRDTEV